MILDFGESSDEIVFRKSIEGVSSIGQEEWQETSRGMLSVVVCEFSIRDPSIPIVLFLIYVESEEGFDFLIDSFCLTVSLGVVSGGRVGRDI